MKTDVNDQDPSLSVASFLLNARTLRELIREARNGFAPDHVGRALRHPILEIVEEDAEEMEEILAELVNTARERLHDAGLEPILSEKGAPPKLPKRERENMLNMAVLLAHLGLVRIHSQRGEEALETAREGLGWCRTGGDRSEEARLWLVVASAQSSLQDLKGEEESLGNALEAARAAGDHERIITALSELTAFMIVRWRLDEADDFSTQAMAMVKDGRRYPRYAILLMNKGRITMFRAQYGEAIRILREALRWADADEQPMDRARIMVHLGAVYLRLQHFQQSIECQHEMVRLAERLGSRLMRGWGYYRLAEAHITMQEYDTAEEMLNRAEQDAHRKHLLNIRLAITAKRSQILAARGRYEEAIDLCRWLIDQPQLPLHDLEMFAHRTLAEIEWLREDYDAAARNLRNAIVISDREFPQRSPELRVYLAEMLHKIGHHDEVTAILDEIAEAELNPAERTCALRLRSLIAENEGELAKALEYEREANDVERELMKRRAEESLRNARIVAETDLLEREADLERERRRRVEHELAEAVVSLGDRNRVVEMVERKLRSALEGMEAEREKSVINVVRETLQELRPSPGTQESARHYLAGIDAEFHQRLRARYPDLTPKQERLCGLIRAGLSSREISTLMELESEGLKAQRKRLRRRLGLQPDERLEVVLAGV
jgi:tetratricopeptide (TPR) repeat protein